MLSIRMWVMCVLVMVRCANADTLSASEAYKLVEYMRGEDERLIVPSVSEETRQRQEDGGCDKMNDAIESIIHEADSSAWAALYLSTCVNSNVDNRDYLANYSDEFHEAVVKMLHDDDEMAKSAASELIWIATFNHGGHILKFIRADVVQALADVILEVQDDHDYGVIQMWAAAALQNLAANYCDPYCDYLWHGDPHEKKHLLVDHHSTPVTVEGTAIRKRILEIDGLLPSLERMVCMGPVWEPDGEIPWPGSVATKWNYPYNVDNSYPSLVPWAAAGLLKNLALLPEARQFLEKDQFMICMCRLAQSEDWLEELKANQFFYHMRPDYPCHYYQDEDALCIDWDGFVDEEGYSCSGYERHHCEEYGDRVGVLDDVTIKHACCVCNGGEYSKLQDYYPEHDL